jgi:hypothetical protein
MPSGILDLLFGQMMSSDSSTAIVGNSLPAAPNASWSDG